MPSKRMIGRNKRSAQNLAYKTEGRKQKNKVAKLKSHIKHNPFDEQAVLSLEKIEKGEVGVKPRRKWFKKYKPNHLNTNSQLYPPMMYRSTTQ